MKLKKIIPKTVHYYHSFLIKTLKGEILYPKLFSAEEYSKFKHGDINSANNFAGILCKSFFKKYKSKLNKNVPIIVVSPPYWKVPFASTFLSRYFTLQLNKSVPNYCSCMELKAKNFFFNYTNLSFKKREKIKDDIPPYFISSHQISKLKKAIIIFVDDIYVTGSTTEQNLIRMKYLGIDKIFVATIARCSSGVQKKYPKIEPIINNTYVKSPENLIRLVKKPEWKITTCAMRSLLFSNENQVKKLINEIPKRACEIFLFGLKNYKYKTLKSKKHAKIVMKYLIKKIR